MHDDDYAPPGYWDEDDENDEDDEHRIADNRERARDMNAELRKGVLS